MGGTIIKMKGNGSTDILEAADALKKQMYEDDAEMVSESWRGSESVKVALLSFERLYLRNGSYASLTVLLTESRDSQTADLIGSGGGAGPFNLSWGANASFARSAAALLRGYGFETEER